MGFIALVVLETGSTWPCFRFETPDVLALGQAPDEPCDMLLRQACDRAQRCGGVINLGAVACNTEVDAVAMRRRMATAQILLSAVRRSDCGRIVLSAREGVSRMVRSALLRLAWTLNEATNAKAARVSVLVGERFIVVPDALPISNGARADW